MLQKKPLLSIVIPVFNEEESIGESVRRFLALRDSLLTELKLELLFVNDGSRDSSLSLLKSAADKDPDVKIISFSRNFGHQIAITAGIDLSSGDYVALIDADLQDPPELIADMYRLALTGYDVVYGKRRSRAGESLFKKATASAFYRFLNYMCEIEIPNDTGDFRLMSRKVVNAFTRLRERHRFVRGMVPWLGFRTAPLEYDRAERYAGTTKFPLRKMFAFAVNAILSFSRKPLTVAIQLGFFIIFMGLIFGAYLFYARLFTNTIIPGFATTLLCVIVFSGVQVMLIGVVGEYIARIFEEVQGRPLYLINETFNLVESVPKNDF
ncbi:MAG TPA: glycosyltransferase [Elusimicrobia bacterium]|nr:glycosyltransferase [Elusimicrobiota bacterium]